MRWLLNAWVDASAWAFVAAAGFCVGLVGAAIVDAMEQAVDARRGMSEFKKRSLWADRFNRWPRSRMFW